MKKIATIIIAIMLCACCALLSACGGDYQTDSSPVTSVVSESGSSSSVSRTPVNPITDGGNFQW